VLTPEFLPVPAVDGGGVETILNDFLDINEQNHEADIEVFSIFNEKAKEKSKQYRNANFNFYKLIPIKFRNFFPRVMRKFFKQRFIFNKRYFKGIIKDIEKKEYDYLLVENKVDLIPYLYKHLKNNQIKILVHIHNSDQIKPNFLVDLSSQCYGVIAVSEYVKKLVMSKYPTIEENKVKVIYNFSDISEDSFPVDPKQVEEFKVNNNISEDEKVILYSGRVIESKGIMQLFKAVREINDPKVDLLIIGNSWYGMSNEQTEFQRQLSKEAESIPGKVIFTGYVDHKNLGLYYSVSDICIFPSIEPETAGLVQLEAMGYKRMTIVSDSGGMPEYMGTDGFIVPLGSEFQENLNRTLQNVVQMDKSELSKRGESLYRHSLKFNGEKSFNQLIDFMNGENISGDEKKE
jgi:glycosyltransferase involved in cell wall biosynthesis